jgi:predicted phosphodiesterase
MSLKEIIAEYSNRFSEKSHTEIASAILLDYDTLSISHRTLRRKVGELRNGPKSGTGTDVSSKDAVLTYKGTEQIDSLEKAIKHFEVDLNVWEVGRYTCNSWDAPTKTGSKTFYQVKVHLTRKVSGVDWARIKEDLKHSVDGFQIYNQPGTNHCVLVLSDFHIGAQVDAIGNTPSFSTKDVVSRLQEVATNVNGRKYKKVTVCLLGDFIESFTGISHESTWKELEKDGYGSHIVITAYTILRRFLTSLTNTVKVAIVSGNHDRLTPKLTGDPQGSVASLLAYMLQENTSLNIEYHPLLLGIEVDGIFYLLTHNHYNISKGDLGKAFWEHGKQGMYNVMLGGHWHSRRGKRVYSSVEEKLVDQANYRQIAVAPLFTGNFYSESNGWNSSPGYTVIENNGRGKPNVFEYVL